MTLALPPNAADYQSAEVNNILNYMHRLNFGGNRPPATMYDRFGGCFARQPEMNTPW
jgi:hypothetical protein